ncbi:MAG: E3 binding domain-containing protein, partial [Acidobacteriota bacterium]|nr:E3 binding domain-containing protein [Acidobacteriota bacterium]
MGTLVDVTILEDQLEGTESVLTQWFVQVGERAEIHEPLLELTTDKVTVEIAAPASGILTEQLKAKDDEVAPGDIVGRIDPAGGAAVPAGTATRAATGTAETAATAAAAKAPAVDMDARELRLSPSVRKLLEEKAIDPSAIRGTGRGGRIT